MFMKDNLEKEDRFDNEVENLEDDPELYMIAAAVAALSLRTMYSLDWVDWKDLDEKDLGDPNVSEGLGTRVFKSIAKFILSIYDVEDFVRYYDLSSISGQCKSLYRELPRLESKHDPLKFIAERRINLENYSLLMEQEFSFAIHCHFNVEKVPLSDNRPRPHCAIPVTPLDSRIIRTSIFPELRNIKPQTIGYNYVSMVITVMEEFKPLKEDIKIHLIMEHGKKRCYCISLRLFLEAFMEMKFVTLEKYFSSCKQPKYLEETSSFLWLQMEGLDTWREHAVIKSSSSATRPLTCGLFGQFADEVIEVIKYADINRRCQGHRFVGVHHILWALSLTAISGSVERIINDTGLKSLCEEPAQYPVYDMYMSSRNLANFLGVEKVGVEHLVIAVLFGRSLRREEKKVNKRKKKPALDKDLSVASDGDMWNAVLTNKSVQMFLNGVKVTIESKDIKTLRGSDVDLYSYPELLGMIKQIEDDLNTGSCSFPPIREEHCPWSLRCQTYLRNFGLSCDGF